MVKTDQPLKPKQYAKDIIDSILCRKSAIVNVEVSGGKIILYVQIDKSCLAWLDYMFDARADCKTDFVCMPISPYMSSYKITSVYPVYISGKLYDSVIASKKTEIASSAVHDAFLSILSAFEIKYYSSIDVINPYL